MQIITPKELEPSAHDRTGWRALTRHAMDTFEERRRTQIEEARERRKASADAPGDPGAGIMEADDRKVTTVFTVQPSFHHRYSTNPVS